MKVWTIGIAGAAIALALLVFLSRPAAADGRENGTFENDCCGVLELRDGGMILNHKQIVDYTAGQDARGPYILPRTYVGALEDKGFEVDGTRPRTKLRLDRVPGPTLIQLYDGPTPYLFKRKPQRAGRRLG